MVDHTGRNQEIWISATYADMTRLGDPDAQWDFTRTHIDGVLLHANRVGHPKHSYPLDRLTSMVSSLKKDGIGFAVESEGTFYCDPPEESGRTSAEDLQEKLAPLYEAGGECSLLTLDGGGIKLLFPGAGRRALPLDEAIEQTIIMLRILRKRYPHMKIHELVNFPNWGWRGEPAYRSETGSLLGFGDYLPVLEKLLLRTKEAGVPLDGVTVDNPYGYAKGTMIVEKEARVLKDPGTIDWMARIRDLEDVVRMHGLEYNLIVNDQMSGGTSSETFQEETLKFIADYRAAGGSPDRWILESWYQYPDRVEPEDGDFTLTSLAKAAILLLRS